MHKSEENASLPCFRQVISSSCAKVVVSLSGPIMLEREPPAPHLGFLTANQPLHPCDTTTQCDAVLISVRLKMVRVVTPPGSPSDKAAAAEARAEPQFVLIAC